MDEIIANLVDFKYKMIKRLDASQRSYLRMCDKYSEWLTKPLLNTELENKIRNNPNLVKSVQNIKAQKGRPKAQYDDLSERGKRHRTQDMRQSFTTTELLAASTSSLRSESECGRAKVINSVSSASPGTVNTLKMVCDKKISNEIRQYSTEQALAIIVDCKLSVDVYKTLRLGAIDQGIDLYPSYHKVLEEKKKSYPKNIKVSENECSVELQDLLDNTCERFLTGYISNNLDSVLNSLTELTFVYKYGMDGSTGYSAYKQVTQDDTIDDSLFIVTLLPIRLIGKQGQKEVIVWSNPRPSSTSLCRPVKLLFKKETPELIKNIHAEMQNLIMKLNETHVSLGQNNITVKHHLILSMIDGKVSQVLSETRSSLVCNICGAAPSEMNKLNVITMKPVKDEILKFGVSPLHAYICFYECILHIAYRLEFKKWRVDKSNKLLMENQKKRIQNEIRDAIGLRVDFPCSGGSGNTNDGNSARRFFENYEKMAEITRVDATLIWRLSVILKTINVNYEIDPVKFNEYALETADLYITLYPWYYMPKSMHQILIHGGQVISTMLVPIGLLSEEAQETRNKDNKYFRVHHTRKSNRISGNEDLIHNLLLSSDPIISSLRRKKKSHRMSALPPEVISLLKNIEHQE